MDRNLIEKITNFFFKLEKKKIYFQKILNGGKNSKILKFSDRKNHYAIKIYKDLNRLKREKLFYVFLKKNKVSSVPKLLYSNEKLKFIIFEYIIGKKVKKISKSDLTKLLIFLKTLNRQKNLNLPLSIDGIKNRADHIKLCQKKIKDLKLIDHEFLKNSKLKNFIYCDLIPTFDYFKNKTKNKIYKKYLINLSKKELIVSPSDIGFHNIIKNEKKLIFIDFEYAGLDDPLKLICDFLAQPDQKLTALQKKQFIENELFSKNKISNINYLVNLFLPFHKLKWCCIMLNEIRSVSQKKQKIGSQKKILFKNQINKTINYFNRNF